MVKVCYVCGNEVAENEQRSFYNMCVEGEKEQNTDASWIVAVKYALEWTYWNKPNETDMQKYVQFVPGTHVDNDYAEVVCKHCIDKALSEKQ